LCICFQSIFPDDEVLIKINTAAGNTTEQKIHVPGNGLWTGWIAVSQHLVVEDYFSGFPVDNQEMTFKIMEVIVIRMDGHNVPHRIGYDWNSE